jgi:hypothetical protein
MKLKDTLSATLLAMADRRWTLNRLLRLRPDPRERYGWGRIFAKALVLGTIWAVVYCVSITPVMGGGTAWWALEYGFWPAFAASLIWGTLTRMVWNRRTAALAAAGGAEPSRSWLPWWLRWLVGPAYVLVLAVFLPLVLVASAASLRAKMAWESYRRELVAAGVKLTPEEITPPPIPDDQNFAATPLYRQAESFFGYGSPRTPAEKAAFDRLNAMHLPRVDEKDLGDWRRQTTVNMAAIQQAFREDKDMSNHVARADTAAGVLETMKQWDKELAELTEAAKRPHSRFPIRYEDTFAALLPHLGPMRGQSQLFSLRASAEVQTGEPQKALDDVLVGLRIGDAVAEEPILISGLVAVAVDRVMEQPIWEGMKGGVWNEAQLARLDAALAKKDFTEVIRHDFEGERVLSTFGLLQQFTGGVQQQDGVLDMPSGARLRLVSFIGYRNAIAINRLYDEILKHGTTAFEGASSKYVPTRAGRWDGEEFQIDGELAFLGPPSPGNMLARLLVPAVKKASDKASAAQAGMDVVRTAIALERFKLAHGKYPASLDELVPALMPRVPLDPFSRKLLVYRATSDGRFLVYSLGPNGSDDHGILASKPKARETAKNPADDIAWTYLKTQP